MKKLEDQKRTRAVRLPRDARRRMTIVSGERRGRGAEDHPLEAPLRPLASPRGEEIEDQRAGLIDAAGLDLHEAIRIVAQLEQNLHGAGTPGVGRPSLPRSAEDLQHLINRLCEFSMTDGLTGLRNRTYFLDVLGREFKRVRRVKEPCSVAIIDLDHFKQVNDTYGHLTGDAVLRHVARLMLATMRETDTLTRYGGEEFGLILPDANSAQARVLAERMRRCISSSVFTFRDLRLNVTASFGVSTHRFDDGLGEQELIERADVALYAAKRAGRNRVSCFADGAKAGRMQITSHEKELLVSQ
ncbi:MAG: GGDEF domain-containing protein [Candidatus Tectomicrobia bacterium]|nr:GGDEF domain-containing protein [Candidatus Tectomicrobia bacterium]